MFFELYSYNAEIRLRLLFFDSEAQE